MNITNIIKYGFREKNKCQVSHTSKTGGKPEQHIIIKVIQRHSIGL